MCTLYISGNSANLSARNADSRMSTAMSGRPTTQQSQSNNDDRGQRMSTTEVSEIYLSGTLVSPASKA